MPKEFCYTVDEFFPGIVSIGGLYMLTEKVVFCIICIVNHDYNYKFPTFI